ncbi:MAG: hypothetical protein U1E15_12320 [Hyphomicrobiales bacterium]
MGRNFRGRGLLLALLALPQALPTIVVALALVAVYGNAGLFPGLINLYGLGGILLAHAFTRRWRCACRFSPWKPFRLKQHALPNPSELRAGTISGWWNGRPCGRCCPGSQRSSFCSVRQALSSCLPSAVHPPQHLPAIYQSLRMDFDLNRTASLVFLQVLLCLLLTFAAGRATLLAAEAPRLRLAAPLPAPRAPVGSVALLAVLILLLPPLASLLLEGTSHLHYSAALARAALTSVMIAMPSALLSIALALGLSVLQARRPTLSAAAGTLALAGFIVPPAVMATGWFLALRNFDVGLTGSLFLIAALNSLMALPFTAALLMPAVARTLAAHDLLARQLGMGAWARLRIADGPVLRPVLGQAFILAFIMSFGDLAAVTLLGTGGIVTLPSLIASQMGHYQGESAMGTALLLALFTLAGSLAAQRIGKTP